MNVEAIDFEVAELRIRVPEVQRVVRGASKGRRGGPQTLERAAADYDAGAVTPLSPKPAGSFSSRD